MRGDLIIVYSRAFVRQVARWFLAWGLVFSGYLSGAVAAEPASSPWKTGLQLGVKESYDDNVFLQSRTPRADHASFVTSVLPRASVGWERDASRVGLAYAPEATFFHEEPTEDSVTHRVQADASLGGSTHLLEAQGSFVGIDGSAVGPIWTGPGGAPATGGPAVRDRRDAAVVRTSVRFRQDVANGWFVRPLASFYEHDFQTEHRATAGYQNYVDRAEFQVGADAGRTCGDGVRAWVGYRFGRQDEARLLGFPEEYDNRFQRVLLGVEGAIARCLRGGLAAGPDVRRYGDHVPAAFGSRERATLFLDGTLTLQAGPEDTLTATARQFEQPGFGGRSAYDDLTLDLTWRHRWDRCWTIGAGTRAYHTYFLRPMARNDWIFAANGLVQRSVTAHLVAEASYQFEEGATFDDGAAAREYHRHLVSLGLNYRFR